MQQQFLTFVEHYGYFAISLLIMGEDFGMPLPGETAAGVRAGAGDLAPDLVRVPAGDGDAVAPVAAEPHGRG